MLIQAVATEVGRSYLAPFSLPALVAAVLLVGALLSLVFIALRSKDDVRAGLQLKPWSITFSLDARKGGRELPTDSESKLAPRDADPASKP
jgi:hypothetical protein